MNQEHQERVRAHWEDPKTVSLADPNLRQLEVEALCAWLQPQHQALDLGCGDGVNSVVFAARVQSLLGVDYSGEMIRRARERIAGGGPTNMSFRQLPAQELDALEPRFDLVISQRCLINLDSWESQLAAIQAVHGLLPPGGTFLMLECLDQGLEAINDLRAQMDLDPLKMPWHNHYLNLDQLLTTLQPLFEVKAQQDFSMYYLLTRVLNPSLGLEHTDPISRQLDQAARRMQATLRPQPLSGLGPQRLLVLGRKD